MRHVVLASRHQTAAALGVDALLLALCTPTSTVSLVFERLEQIAVARVVEMPECRLAIQALVVAVSRLRSDTATEAWRAAMTPDMLSSEWRGSHLCLLGVCALFSIVTEQKMQTER